MNLEEYEKSKEFEYFLNPRDYFCGCCHQDISKEASPEIKNRIDENKQNMAIELFICNECVNDKFCKSTNYHPHPHTSLGKEWLIESVIKRETDWIKHCEKHGMNENSHDIKRSNKIIDFWSNLRCLNS